MNLQLLVLLCVAAAISNATKDDNKEKLSYHGMQSYRCIGRLLCDGKPAAGVTVKLYDKDTSIDPDDTLENGVTKADGTFDLMGSTSELWTIDPFLKIYHDCNDGIKLCQRRWKFELPNKYISEGEKTQHRKVMDIGTWDLEAILPDEERDCLH